MDDLIRSIRKSVKKKLDEHRYEHTLGVAYTAQALAMRYGYDLRRAEIAGLLHDCAKRFDRQEMLKKCVSRGIPVSESEKADPSLLHAKLGAWYAKNKYGIEDEEILSAIACHTTGKPNMSLLDEILYVADYIEPGRDQAPNLAEHRKLAFLDLDEACLAIMESILAYLKGQEKPIDTLTVAACVDMRRKVAEKKTSGRKKTEADGNMDPSGNKEETTGESGKRNRKTRSRGFGRKKG